MNHFQRFFGAGLVLLLTLWAAPAWSQCTINYNPTAPGIYPDTLPDGLVASLYSEDITFVMPLDTQGFAFTNFEIVSITGLPFGLSWECNNWQNGCNYDPAQSQYGCINVSGTPIAPGSYTLDVYLIASLGVLGDYPTHYYTPVIILPDTTSNSGFSMTNAFGCLPITVDFTNNNPGLLAYQWDFGNGNSSTAEDPTPQIYNSAGTYYVNYEAYSDTVPDYFLTEVQVLSIPNNWGWPGDLNPDIYVEVIDTSGTILYTSGTINDQDPPVTFAIPNLPMDAMNYTVHVWDEDGGIFGADDDLGTTDFYGQGPSGSSTTGSTSISYNIVSLGPFPVASSLDSVQVFGIPNPPNIDSTGFLLWTDSVNLNLQWYQDGNPIAGADSASWMVTESGNFWVIATSPAGCFASSDTISYVICDTNFQPTITQNGNLLYTDSTSNQIQWYYGGAPINGETSQLIVANDTGSYYVTVTTLDGCTYSSDVIVYNNTSTVDLALADAQLNLWPNPNNGQFQLDLQLGKKTNVNLVVLDATGRLVYREEAATSHWQTSIDLSSVGPGVYLTVIQTSQGRLQRKLIVR